MRHTLNTASSQERSLVMLLPHGITSNLYVRELGRAYMQLGLQVVFGTENLVESGIAVDFVHLQWPEEHYRWSGQGAPAERADLFVNQLKVHKNAGAKIIWTVHNLMPHEHPMDALDQHVYQTVIDLATVIVHHCSISQELLAQRFRHTDRALQIILPHGHYQAYGPALDKANARVKLGLPPKAFIYLHFGQVRAYKGLGTLLSAYRLVKFKRKHLVVAGRYSQVSTGAGIFERLQMIWLKKFARHISTFLHEVPNNDVPIYMAAADAVVLSHISGLNSGVAVLAMTYGKPVIGPELGCMGNVLTQGRNLLYPTGNVEALAKAMVRVTEVNLEQVAAVNKEIAQSWDWKMIAKKIMDASCQHPNKSVKLQ